MKKILIIEDNEMLRGNTAEILELSHYKVVCAANGKEGMQLVLEESPDLILCDIMMPVVDGYGVLHMLHQNPGHRKTPFIFLTAKTGREDMRKGMEQGADDYLTKPFTATELLHAVERQLNKAQAIQEEIERSVHGASEQMENALNVKFDSLHEGRNVEQYRKKQVIYYQGNRPQYLYYIQKGKVKTFRRNDDGKELVTALYSDGEYFGYIPLMQSCTYKDTAEAIEPCDIALIPHDEFEHLMQSSKDISNRFMQLLASNLMDKEQHLVNLAYNSLRKKVADALLFMHGKLKKEGEEDVILNIGRETMAAIAGTATESFIRTLSDFRNEKLIDIRDSSVIILNPSKLENMVN